MKRNVLPGLLLCLLCVAAAGCTENEPPQAGSGNGLVAQEAAPAAGDVAQHTQAAATDESEPVDIDLTALSRTMIYAEVSNMMTTPDDYIGKTIKMSGPYAADYSAQTGQYYHYVILPGIDACCSQGFEFVWNGNHTYPDDYPADQTNIEVVGVFGGYEELGQTYYCVTIDELSVLQ